MSASDLSSNGTSRPPLYGMPIAEPFLADGDEKTFQHDENLPSLPMPPLHQTLAKYLDSGMKYAVYFRRTLELQTGNTRCDTKCCK